jgi:hypothetical protein
MPKDRGRTERGSNKPKKALTFHPSALHFPHRHEQPAGYHTNMTKSQELNFLEEVAKRLAGDTYSGAWFRDQLPQLEKAIRGDMPAEVYAVGFSDAMNERAAILDKAREEAKEIIANAQAAAGRELEGASKRAAELQRQAEMRVANLQASFRSQVLEARAALNDVISEL